MTKSFIHSNFEDALLLSQQILSDPQFITSVEQLISMAINTYHNGGKIMICGNGGSMCDATHCAEELTGRFKKDRPPLAAISINDAAHMSCVANDYGYDAIFSRSVEALGKSEDLFIAISTSGNSKNVIQAVNSATQIGMKTVGLLGKDGGELKTLVNLPITVPSQSTERIQEIHIKIIHNLIEGIERTLFPNLYNS